MNLPVPTFQEARVLDTKLKDKSKAGNKCKLCWFFDSVDSDALSNRKVGIAHCEPSTKERWLASTSTVRQSPFVHKKVDNTQLLIGDIILTLDQWNGEQNYTDVVTFRCGEKDSSCSAFRLPVRGKTDSAKPHDAPNANNLHRQHQPHRLWKRTCARKLMTIFVPSRLIRCRLLWTFVCNHELLRHSGDKKNSLEEMSVCRPTALSTEGCTASVCSTMLSRVSSGKLLQQSGQSGYGLC